MNMDIIEHQGNSVQEIQPIAPTVENLRTFLKVPEGKKERKGEIQKEEKEMNLEGKQQIWNDYQKEIADVKLEK